MAGGFTLLETLLVVAVVGILTAIATLNFRAYSLRYQSEAQTRLLHGELMKVRAQAVSRGRGGRVKLYPARFEIYSSLTDDTAGSRPVLTQQLSFPITCTARRGSAATGFLIDFDHQGITFDNCSICLDPEGTGAVDSIKVYTTRISVGKKDTGHDCKADYITAR